MLEERKLAYYVCPLEGIVVSSIVSDINMYGLSLENGTVFTHDEYYSHVFSNEQDLLHRLLHK